MNDNIILKENKYNITTEKNNKMDLYLRYYENEEIQLVFILLIKLHLKNMN